VWEHTTLRGGKKKETGKKKGIRERQIVISLNSEESCRPGLGDLDYGGGNMRGKVRGTRPGVR